MEISRENLLIISTYQPFPLFYRLLNELPVGNFRHFPSWSRFLKDNLKTDVTNRQLLDISSLTNRRTFPIIKLQPYSCDTSLSGLDKTKYAIHCVDSDLSAWSGMDPGFRTTKECRYLVHVISAGGGGSSSPCTLPLDRYVSVMASVIHRYQQQGDFRCVSVKRYFDNAANSCRLNAAYRYPR